MSRLRKSGHRLAEMNLEEQNAVKLWGRPVNQMQKGQLVLRVWQCQPLVNH